MDLPENDVAHIHMLDFIPYSALLIYSKSCKHSATDIKVPLGKLFRNLISGEDKKLTDAHALFHKMVEQEQRVVSNLILAGVEKVNKNTSAMHTDVKVALAATKRTNGDTKALMASTGRMHRYLESKTTSGASSFQVIKVI